MAHRGAAEPVYAGHREARQPDGCRASFAFWADASEALAKLAAPGFKFALAGNSAATSRC